MNMDALYCEANAASIDGMPCRRLSPPLQPQRQSMQASYSFVTGASSATIGAGLQDCLIGMHYHLVNWLAGEGQAANLATNKGPIRAVEMLRIGVFP